MQEMKRKALARVWAVVGLAVWLAGQCVGSAYAAGSIDQEYADTRQRECVLAVRADVFEGFLGEVEVVLEDSFGEAENCILSPENRYARNLKVAEGSYRLMSVKAGMGGQEYEVKKMSSALHTKPGEVEVCRLVVTEYQILEEVMETEKVQENPGDYAEDGQGMETEGRITTEMEENRMEQNRPLIGKKMTIFLWLAAFGAAAGYWYIRYGRKKYGR